MGRCVFNVPGGFLFRIYCLLSATRKAEHCCCRKILLFSGHFWLRALFLHCRSYVSEVGHMDRNNRVLYLCPVILLDSYKNIFTIKAITYYLSIQKSPLPVPLSPRIGDGGGVYSKDTHSLRILELQTCQHR